MNHWVREGLYGAPEALPADPAAAVQRPLLGAPDAGFSDRSPIPRRRDSSGTAPTPTPKSYHPTPGHELLLPVYTDALKLIRAFLPLRAARLEDLMRRVDKALACCRSLRVEEERHRSSDLRTLDERRAALDREIDDLTRLLEQKRAETEPRVQECLDAWCRARQAAAWIYAAAGQDFPQAEDDQLQDTLQFVPVSRLERIEGAGSAEAETPAAPEDTRAKTAEPPRSLKTRFLSFMGLDKPLPGSE
jgi:hypothetical protein